MRTSQRELLPYYERSLDAVRRQAGEFVKRHPNAANKLLINSEGRCQDPHVERLIEAFAYLTAGVHQRLEDDFAELAGALLQVVAPHLLAPIPSVSILHLEPGARLDNPVFVPKGTMLDSRPINGAVCRYVTSYPTWIWPIDITPHTLALPMQLGLREECPMVLRVTLKSRAGTLASHFRQVAQTKSQDPAERTRVRIYLHGDGAYGLYDILGSSVSKVLIRSGESGVAHPIELRPVGFESSDLLWAGGPRSLDSYGLLQEYFACPQKFLFFDLLLSPQVVQSLDKEAKEADVFFLLERNPGTLGGVSLRLSCTPCVNLFPKEADAITVRHEQTDYRVVPSSGQPQAYEVYSVERVRGSEEGGVYLPLYSQQHLTPLAYGGASFGVHGKNQEGPLGYYLAERRDPLPRQSHTEVYLSFVDLQIRHRSPVNQRLNVTTRCTSGDLPNLLGGEPRFTPPPGAQRVQCLLPPTMTRRASLGRGVAWRLISLLSLNYLSVGDHASGARPEAAILALRELLVLHAAHVGLGDKDPLYHQILDLAAISTEPTIACQKGMAGPCRGLRVSLSMESTSSPSDKSTSQILFASVLERFLGRYVSINSFTQLVAKDRHDRVLKRWAPRAGDRVLI